MGRRVSWLILMAALVVATMVPATAAMLGWTFDTYSDGTLAGQDGWYSSEGETAWEVTSADPLSGAKSAKSTAHNTYANHSIASQTFTDNRTTYTFLAKIGNHNAIVVGYLYQPSIPGTIDKLYMQINVRPDGIWCLYGDAVVYEGQYEYFPTYEYITDYVTPGDIYKITFRWDFPNHLFHCDVKNLTNPSQATRSGWHPLDSRVTKDNANGYLAFRSLYSDAGTWVDDVAFSEPTDPQVSGQMILPETGPRAANVCGIQFIQSGVVKRQEVVSLYGDNNFTSSPFSPGGTYDLKFTVPGFLTKTVTGVAINGPITLPSPITLTNGDVDGDNVISANDLSVILKSLDQEGQ